MKIVLNVLFIALALTASSCIGGFMDPDITDRGKKSNYVMTESSKKIEQKYDLELIGVGEAEKDGKTSEMAIIFESEQPLPIEQCRALLVDCVELFLSDINNNKEIQPYLSNTPFTDKNIDVTIHFLNPDRSSTSHPQISTATLFYGNVKFRTKDPKDKLGGYRRIFSETYPEAIEKDKQFRNTQQNGSPEALCSP